MRNPCWLPAAIRRRHGPKREARRTPDLRERMLVAQKQLWHAIEMGRKVINSELWSWSYRDGHYEVAPFGANASDADESNAAQLWSTVYPAIHAPVASMSR